ncbi:phosphatase 2C-like domain-containing protein [Armillaria nabsnona]|nr:phosphatase 2C-like domain-containing protein [Armillaria nabsnona]
MAALVQRAPFRSDWAYAEDIPGTRCGPDDGPWPRSYQVLNEGEVWKEMRMLAKPQSVALGKGRADSVNFQPSLSTRTQDRYVVKKLRVGTRDWSLTGVFDGHLGDVTVEHVAYHLPIIVAEFLRDAYKADPTRLDDPVFISDLFSRSIVAFDDAIAGDVLDLFGGIEGLAEYSDADIRRVINDHHQGGANFRKARLNMYGTTALVALIDPDHGNLWVANLGDCQATLVTASPTDPGAWDIKVLTTEHNGYNDAEIERVRQQHPNEPECVIDNRVLGALAPFRCLGDTPFKQPPEFTRRILYNLSPGFPDTSPWEEFLVRNRTPPYISTEPEIVHTQLGVVSPPERSRFLILASDGFVDLCSNEGQEKIVRDWARDMQNMTADEETHPGSGNMALRLLRRALGGEDRFKVSKVLTLNMDVAWIDDTAIVVQTL